MTTTPISNIWKDHNHLRYQYIYAIWFKIFCYLVYCENVDTEETAVMPVLLFSGLVLLLWYQMILQVPSYG